MQNNTFLNQLVMECTFSFKCRIMIKIARKNIQKYNLKTFQEKLT
jgi:hypothetical protein